MAAPPAEHVAARGARLERADVVPHQLAADGREEGRLQIGARGGADAIEHVQPVSVADAVDEQHLAVLPNFPGS